MQAGIKLGVGAAALALVGGALSAGAVAGAAEPPPAPVQDQSAPLQPESVQHESMPTQPQPDQGEEGQGPGALIVGPEGAAKALDRLQYRNDQRARWCHGTVLPRDGLRVRTGPGTHYRIVGKLAQGTHVTTDWDSIQRHDGYLWVRLRGGSNWIADYKLGNGNGKWYVKYSDC